MNAEQQRIRITCPNCDHDVVTAPERFHFEGALIRPGCGETLDVASALEAEAPDQPVTLSTRRDKLKKALRPDS